MPIPIVRKNIYAIISYPFLPATTGGEISTLNILNFMGACHALKVFTVDPYKPINGQNFNFEIDFGMRFSFWRYLHVFLVIRLIKNIKAFKSDYIFFDQPFMGWMIPIIKFFTGKKVFIRSNNIEYLRFKSMGKSWWPVMYMYEKFVYKSADLVIFVSDVDMQKAINEFNLDTKNTLLTPYGIPQTHLPEKIKNARAILQQKYQIPESNKLFLFFATMSYKPNYDAVGFIAENIYPLLKQANYSFNILICGKNLPDFILQKLKNKPELIYCGFVDDIETYIDGCDAMINPILSGGGIKTKAIDTLGRGQIVISTVTGAEGINRNVCGNNLHVCDDNNWIAFVNSMKAAIIQNNRELPEDFFYTYSWPHIINKLTIKLNTLSS